MVHTLIFQLGSSPHIGPGEPSRTNPLNLDSGVMGFPCWIVDDPLLSLVMSEEDDYPHAEERRLFHVAVTWARKHLYLLDDAGKPPVFM